MLIRLIGNQKPEVGRQFAVDLGCDRPGDNLKWPPPTLVEVTEKQFWHNRASTCFLAEAWCSAIKINGEWATPLAFYVDQGHLMAGGFIVLYWYQGGRERVSYYQWRACEHVFEYKSTGNCQHKYTCTKCDRVYEVDSSG